MHRRNTGTGQDSNLERPDERPTPLPWSTVRIMQIRKAPFCKRDWLIGTQQAVCIWIP